MKLRNVFARIMVVLLLVTMATSIFVPSTAASISCSGKFGYSQLGTEAERNAYVKIVQAIDSLEEYVAFTPDENITKDQLVYIAEMIHTDFPEYFYYHSLYSYRDDDGNIETIGLTYNIGDTSVLESAASVAGVKAAFDKKVNEIVSGISMSASDTDKARYVHDYIVKHAAYGSADNYGNAYGALINGSCTCAGYANAYTLLMCKLGIKTWYISGVSANGVRHAWNVSWIDGVAMYTDVCWDDSSSDMGYRYFNLDYNTMSKDHIEDGRYWMLASLSGGAKDKSDTTDTPDATVAPTESVQVAEPVVEETQTVTKETESDANKNAGEIVTQPTESESSVTSSVDNTADNMEVIDEESVIESIAPTETRPITEVMVVVTPSETISDEIEVTVDVTEETIVSENDSAEPDVVVDMTWISGSLIVSGVMIMFVGVLLASKQKPEL